MQWYEYKMVNSFLNMLNGKILKQICFVRYLLYNWSFSGSEVFQSSEGYFCTKD